MSADFKDELKKLKPIKYEQIKRYGCVAVQAPIDVLSLKERGKVIFILCNSLVKAKSEFDKINANHSVFKSNVKKTIQDVDESLHEKYSKDDVIRILNDVHDFDPTVLQKASNDT